MKLKLGFALLLAAVVALSSLPSFAAAGAVYTLNNSSSGNAVLVLSRSAEGQISLTGMFSTGWTGTGKGLGNQGALAMDVANRFLFAVNAGSDNISVFRIGENNLHLVDLVPSGGKQPISLTVNRNVLYVLNNGGAVGSSDTIAGFSVGANGHLRPIVRGLPLSATSVGPAQIGFNSDGDLLVVAEKNTNNIDVFSVDDDGVAVGPTVVPSAGQTPFGFAFGKRNQVFVSDAFGGAANAGAVSSYEASDDGGRPPRLSCAFENPRWHARRSHFILARSKQPGRNQKGSGRDGAAGALGGVMPVGEGLSKPPIPGG